MVPRHALPLSELEDFPHGPANSGLPGGVIPLPADAYFPVNYCNLLFAAVFVAFHAVVLVYLPLGTTNRFSVHQAIFAPLTWPRTFYIALNIKNFTEQWKL